MSIHSQVAINKTIVINRKFSFWGNELVETQL